LAAADWPCEPAPVPPEPGEVAKALAAVGDGPWDLLPFPWFSGPGDVAPSPCGKALAQSIEQMITSPFSQILFPHIATGVPCPCSWDEESLVSAGDEEPLPDEAGAGFAGTLSFGVWGEYAEVDGAALVEGLVWEGEASTVKARAGA